jgi:L-lactate dehydrogenase complex protein LldE
MSFALQIPCIMQHFFPETMANLIKLCANAKYTVTIPENQTCCGLPYFEKGELKTAKSIGEYNLSLFAQNQLISGSPKCCDTFMAKYPKIFNNTVSHNESVNLSKHIVSLYDLFEKLSLNNVKAVKSSYYFVPNCQPANEGSKSLAAKFPHSTWFFPKLQATCCGAGTCMPTTNKDYAFKMALNLINESIESKADFIVTEDDICRKHLQNVAKEHQLEIQTLHIIDLFALAL